MSDRTNSPLEAQTPATTRAITATIPALMFTPAEQAALEALRARFHEDHDRFSDIELAYLQFLRWLRTIGALAA